MKKTLIGLLASVAALGVASSATAAPTTVNLRIEGPTATVYEGPVTTDARTFKFTDSATTYPCDGTATYGGTATSAVPVRGGAIITAAEQNGFALLGSFGMYGASFSKIGDQVVDYDPVSGRYLGEFKNGVSSNLGACGDAISSGDDVVFAYSDYTETLLGLTGPATLAPGASGTAKVVDQGAANAPVAGATLGGRTTGADGTVAVGPFTERGDHDLKATAPGHVRSNRLRVCVTDGADGFCGTTKPGETPTTPTTPTTPVVTPPAPDQSAGTSKVTGIAPKQAFKKGKGPKTLAGTADGTGSSVKWVKVRLVRKNGSACTTFSGKYERFVKARCGIEHGRWFVVGTSSSWSYLLPSRLPKGAYTLDTRVTDAAGNLQPTVGGANRLTFSVK